MIIRPHLFTLKIWQSILFVLRLIRFHELPALWASALTAAMFSAWHFPGWAVIMGGSHAGYARYHYFIPAMGLTLVAIGSGIVLSSLLVRNHQVSSKAKDQKCILIALGSCLSFLGVVLAFIKGEGAAVFCACIFLLSLVRLRLKTDPIFDAFIAALSVVLIYFTIIFKYQIPTLESLPHYHLVENGLLLYLLTVFLYQFACLAIPHFSQKFKYLAVILLAQPVIVIPTLVSSQWQWHSSFAIPITIFLIWLTVMIRYLQTRPDTATRLLQAGRPLVDFLLLGSIGFALFFKWSGEAHIFNSYTMKTLLLLCPGYFIAGSLIAWIQSRRFAS